MGVLLGVGADAVPVLEIHPEVSDRRAGEYPADMGVDPSGQDRRDAGRRRQVGRLAGVRVEGGPGCGGPVLGDGHGHLVGRHVAGVHRLGGARIPGEAGGQLGVQPGERRGQRGGQIRRQRRHVPSLTPASAAAGG